MKLELRSDYYGMCVEMVGRCVSVRGSSMTIWDVLVVAASADRFLKEGAAKGVLNHYERHRLQERLAEVCCVNRGEALLALEDVAISVAHGCQLSVAEMVGEAKKL